jgi:hypothetical protein
VTLTARILWLLALQHAAGQPLCQRALYQVVRWMVLDSYWRIPEEDS